MDPVTYEAGCLINISNGQIAQTNVNADRALEVGRGQLKQLEASYLYIYFDGCISFFFGQLSDQ